MHIPFSKHFEQPVRTFSTRAPALARARGGDRSHFAARCSAAAVHCGRAAGSGEVRAGGSAFRFECLLLAGQQLFQCPIGLDAVAAHVVAVRRRTVLPRVADAPDRPDAPVAQALERRQLPAGPGSFAQSCSSSEPA